MLAAAIASSCAIAAQRSTTGAAVEARAPSMRESIERYEADRNSIARFWSLSISPTRRAKLAELDRAAAAQLDALDFAALDQDGKIDWILLHRSIDGDLRRLEAERKRADECAPLVPFAPTIIALAEARQLVEPLDCAKTAGELEHLRTAIADARSAADAKSADYAKSVANRAASTVDELDRALEEWYGFRNGYDPTFAWWNAKPYEAAHSALGDYARFLREKLVGVRPGDDRTIIGDPIGRDALIEALRDAMIPYSPEELIQIADKEFAWCDAEMLKASREMGFGDDWKKALEKVKQDHVGPGEQPALIKKLALEATDFVEKRELVTVPPLAKEDWRMTMMSPARQLVNPFFLGGEEIQVSFPTDAMTFDQKEMSMRGNNVHFSRATVFHELIPGHHLQGFMEDRYQTQRRPFNTPFWTEGWALWWEMLLWDQGFTSTPEDRVGALFWRMHRCARIHFSLGFHLGTLTPQQCIDYLVERVGHERANAEGEVRRSFNGGYGPLYQCAYMLGALQFRALHAELVDSHRMSNRDFHDAILHNANMPIEMVRARLENLPLSRDFQTSWRFYDLAK